MYIYKITNKLNGKGYIGQTTKKSVEKRWQQHIGYNVRTLIHRAIKKYGKEAFVFEILAECGNIDELNILEETLIAEMNTLSPAGYNLHKGGRNKEVHLLTRIKLSIAGKKRKFRPTSDGTKAKISKANKGKKRTEEFKRGCRERATNNSGMRGKPYGHRKSVIGIPLDPNNPGWFFCNMRLANKFGFCHVAIAAVAKGKYKQHKGYIWSFINVG